MGEGLEEVDENQILGLDEWKKSVLQMFPTKWMLEDSCRLLQRNDLEASTRIHIYHETRSRPEIHLW